MWLAIELKILHWDNWLNLIRIRTWKTVILSKNRANGKAYNVTSARLYKAKESKRRTWINALKLIERQSPKWEV